MEILKDIHKYEIIHLNITPDSLFITSDGKICLINFERSFWGFTNNKHLTGEKIKKNIYSSINMREGGTPDFDDDYCSLCYTLYALKIGVVRYFINHCQTPPTLKEIEKVSPCLGELIRNRKHQFYNRKLLCIMSYLPITVVILLTILYLNFL